LFQCLASFIWAGLRGGRCAPGPATRALQARNVRYRGHRRLSKLFTSPFFAPLSPRQRFDGLVVVSITARLMPHPASCWTTTGLQGKVGSAVSLRLIEPDPELVLSRRRRDRLTLAPHSAEPLQDHPAGPLHPNIIQTPGRHKVLDHLAGPLQLHKPLDRYNHYNGFPALLAASSIAFSSSSYHLRLKAAKT
jgi:hypothetical protein